MLDVRRAADPEPMKHYRGQTETPCPYRVFLSTGPFVLSWGGKLLLTLENPYSNCVTAEAIMRDLRADPRDARRPEEDVLRETIKLAAFQTGTVSFTLRGRTLPGRTSPEGDPAMPDGLLLESFIRADGPILPLLRLETFHGPTRTLYRSCEYVPLNRGS